MRTCFDKIMIVLKWGTAHARLDINTNTLKFVWFLGFSNLKKIDNSIIFRKIIIKIVCFFVERVSEKKRKRDNCPEKKEMKNWHSSIRDSNFGMVFKIASFLSER